MFSERPISTSLEAIREAHAPGTIVLDADTDFETIPPAAAEDLGLVVDALDPHDHPEEWLPDDAPTLLERYAGESFTIGMPGDGSVVWTRQTTPPVIVVKPRVAGSPESFVDFLLGEALVELGLEVPEHFIGWFAEEYHAFDEAVPLDPNSTYQLAVAAYTAWLGLHTRETFATWIENYHDLGAAWQDAGSRLEPRVSDLPSAVARGDTSIADATELACSAIKHAIELPAPYAALDTDAYRDHGPSYAIAWAERTFEALLE